MGVVFLKRLFVRGLADPNTVDRRSQGCYRLLWWDSVVGLYRGNSFIIVLGREMLAFLRSDSINPQTSDSKSL